MSAPPLVSVHDLCIRFPAGRGETVKAVDGVSFEVVPGETFGIIGESGSGKSTIGRALVSLLKPTSGTVLHEGQALAGLSRRELRHRRRPYQIVFQDPNAALDPRMTIMQSVREPLDIVGTGDAREREEIALRCLDHVGLTAEQGRRYPHELSGGQKQRANIARVLTVRPKLVVCDEAVAALDVSIRAEILNLLADLQREFGLAYVFITHDLGIVSHISRRVAVMYLGAFVETGPVEAVLGRPLHPYTEALSWSQPLPVPVSMRSRERKVLEGEIPNPVNPPSGCRFHTRCPLAQPRCASEVPRLRELVPGRWVACHFPLDIDPVSMN